MKYKMNEPTVGSRASVLSTDLEITFLEKHQLDEVFPFLVEKGYEFSFETEFGDSFNPDKHILTVLNIGWARSVTQLFKFLEELDYNFSFEDDVKNCSSTTTGDIDD